MKKLIVVALCMLMWGGEAFAICQSATITASTPTADFIDYGNGTVTHTKTGLMWKQCSEGLSTVTTACDTGAATTHTWQAALQLAETLNAGAGFAGFNDWRVPNQKELKSIVERQCNNPSINATIFPATVSSGYWSASPYASVAAEAWNGDFLNGDTFGNPKTMSYNVRLIRGGL